MKKLTVFLALLACTYGYSVEMNLLESKNHRIYIQPEISRGLSQYKWDDNGSYEIRGDYYGFNAGYEYLNQDNIYAGIEALVSQGDRVVERHGIQGGFSTRSDSTKSKIEARVGHRQEKGNLSSLAYYGVGEYFFTHSNGYQSTFAYLPVGAKLHYKIKNFTIGVNTAFMICFYAWDSQALTNDNRWNLDNLGVEMTLPFSFQSKGNWNASVEPFVQLLNDESGFFGGRISAGRDF